MTETPSLAETLDQAWALLAQAVSDGRSPLRYVTLATVDTHNAPQSRIVVLRKAERAAATLIAFTDRRSDKVGELARNANVAMHLWSTDDLVQLRMNGRADVIQGSPDDWAAVPDQMREAYGHVPSPGTEIAASDAWRIRPDYSHFACIRITLSRIESVCLDPTGHRRANFERRSDWAGVWLSP